MIYCCFSLSESFFSRAYYKYFRYSQCADELFVQTILINSPRIEKIIDSNLRCIDWKRGNPYTFKLEDYEMLMGSNKLFARKFDISVDRDIILKIYDKLMNCN